MSSKKHRRRQQGLSVGKSKDSYQNFAANLGLGTDNIGSAATYGFNPVTRNRILLEWIHRGSWVGGVAVDVIADDMTRAGAEITGLMHPADVEAMRVAEVRLGIWKKINETIKWSRLYGGAMAVLLIEGHDFRQPLDLDKPLEKGQFKGLAVLDRWQVTPELTDLVETFGPEMGQPTMYRVASGVAGLSGRVIHHSRVIRLDGVPLPYNQRMQENMWGISVLERLYDRMVAFDSATTGAAQLVYKAYIRTLKIQGYKELVGENGPAAAGLANYVDMMRRFQSIEGLNVIDSKDSFENLAAPGFSGLADLIMQLGQQLAGALQVPLVRLFGQSPAGLSSTGESDMRNYYDGILQRQEEQLHPGMMKIYRLLAFSVGVKDADKVGLKFRPLWQLDETQKSEIANKDAMSIDSLYNSGILTKAQSLRELRHQSQFNGHFASITDEDIEAAAEEDKIPELPDDNPASLPAPKPEDEPPADPDN